MVSKLTFLFLLFLALMNYLTAQTPQNYNYNNGTGSNSFPFNQNAGKEVYWLFRPGDINQPSVIAPGNKITNVYIWMSTTGSRTYTDLVILMAQDTLPTFTPGVFYSGHLDTVYYRSSVNLSGTGITWMQIPLDNPLPYDPAKSLIVAIGQCGSTGSGLSIRQTNTSVDYKRVWSVTGCPFTPYTTGDYYIVNFGVDVAPYMAITDIDSFNISCHGYNNGSITINATGGTAPLQYSIDSGATWQSGNVFSDLDPGMYNAMAKDSIGYLITYAYNPILISEPPVLEYLITDTCCKNYILNDSVYTVSGTYIQHLINGNGCDSTITLNLTVNPVHSFTGNYTICDGDTYNWRGADYSIADTYTEKFTNIYGCDSIYTLNLTVNPAYSFNEYHSICDGDTYIWQGTNYATTGTFTANYSDSNGCDSIYALQLLVNPVYSFSENQSICNGDSYNWHGRDYSIEGSYYDSLQTISGCDSLYVLNLSVLTIDNSLTVSDYTITAHANESTYQWLNCDNAFAIISGETSQSYTAATTGSYAVEVTQNLCSDTSECLQINTTDITTFSTEGIIIYPNPVADELIIENKGTLENVDFEILNSSGQIVLKGKLIEMTVVQTKEFAPGVYLIKLQNNSLFNFKKIIKE